MIITLIFVGMFLIGLMLAAISINTSICFDELDLIGDLMMGFGAICTIIVLVIIIFTHVGVDADIQKSKIEYYGLQTRYELVTSDYEDVSKSDVIKDITNWNKNVYSYKRWGKSPWTNWFYSQYFVDQLEYIDINGKWSY